MITRVMHREIRQWMCEEIRNDVEPYTDGTGSLSPELLVEGALDWFDGELDGVNDWDALVRIANRAIETEMDMPITIHVTQG